MFRHSGLLSSVETTPVPLSRRATPEDMEVLSQATVLAKPAWTVPTVVGSRHYVRDRKTIKALDLS